MVDNRSTALLEALMDPALLLDSGRRVLAANPGLRTISQGRKKMTGIGCVPGASLAFIARIAVNGRFR